MRWFTADQHFDHFNVISLCDRPFSSLEEMHETLIANWNSVVSSSDIVYVLGDFSYRGKSESIDRHLRALKGRKVLMYGNHDRVIRREPALQSHFESCHDYLEMHVQDPTVPHGRLFMVLQHYPLLSWNGSRRGSVHLHGHSHGTTRYPFNGRIIDRKSVV